jgi:hypothetical protein
VLRDRVATQELSDFVGEGVAIMSQQIVSIRPGNMEKKAKKKTKYEQSEQRTERTVVCDDSTQPKCRISQPLNVVNEDGEGYLGDSERMYLVRLAENGFAL